GEGTMVKMRRQKGDRMSAAMWILCGGTGAAVIAMLLSMLLALLIVKQVIPQESVRILSVATAAIAAFFAVKFSCVQNRENRFLIATGCSALFFALTMLLKLILFPGATDGIWLHAAACLAGGLLAAVTMGKGRRDSRRARNR
ncbi:MAG: TIGR04086 family membrane protein, partial [Oscillospiraceae bacterium]|nr:TIGR04086 family membrane protein [Oscillospiraceae bacterium]